MPIPADVSTVNIDSDQDDPRLWRADGLDHMEKFNALLAFLRNPTGAAGDGETDDTAAFSALEQEFTGRDVDLLGKTYLVDAVPTGNRYRNGIWRVASYDDGATIDIPAAGTLPKARFRITNNGRYNSNPQGTGFCYDGRHSHSWRTLAQPDYSSSNQIFGQEFGPDGTPDGEWKWILPRNGDRVCYAAGCVDGQELRIVRDGGTTHRLFGRRRWERRENVSALISRVNGVGLKIGISDHGLRVGQSVTISQWTGGTVSGQEPNGTYDVVETYTDGFTISIPAVTSGSAVTRSFNIEFLDSPWSEITFGGNSIGAAVVAADSTLFPTEPIVMHGISPIPGVGGSFDTGAHLGTDQPCQVRVKDLFLTSPAIEFVKQITDEGVEPHFARDSDGNLYVGIRAQDDVAAQIGWSSDDGDSWTLYDLPAYPFAWRSPINLVIAGDWLYAVLSGSRDPDREAEAGQDRRSVGIYLLAVTLSDFRSTGLASAMLLGIDRATWIDALSGSEVTVGTGTISASDTHLLVSYASMGRGRHMNVSQNIVGVSIPLAPDGSILWGADAPAIVSDPPYSEVPEVRLRITWGQSGNLLYRTPKAHGLTVSVSSSSTGVYDFAFEDEFGSPVSIYDNDYFVLSTCVTQLGEMQVTDKQPAGFVIRTYQVGTTTPQNCGGNAEVVLPH